MTYVKRQDVYDVRARRISGRRDEKLEQIDAAIQELLDIKTLECAGDDPNVRFLAVPRPRSHGLVMTVTILVLLVVLVLLLGVRVSRAQEATPRVNELDLDMAAAYARKTPTSGSRWGVEATLQGGEDSQTFGFSPTAPNISGADGLRYLGPTNVSHLFPAGEGLTVQGGVFGSLIGYDSHPNDAPNVGGQIAYAASPRVSIKQTVLAGPHQADTSFGSWRVLSDTMTVERHRQAGARARSGKVTP